MILDLIQCVPSCKIIRILTVRKQHDLHIKSFLQDKVNSSQSSLYTCAITVIYDGNVVCKLADEPYLLYRKRCSAGSDDIGDAQLMHGQYVQISLDKDALVLA